MVSSRNGSLRRVSASDLLGPRAPSPANEREAVKSFEKLRAFSAFAGGAPAVPDNHLIGLAVT